MSVRQMNGPLIDVERHSEDADIVLVRFIVPESKFGPVLVQLTHKQAARLAEDLLDVVEQ